MSIFDLPVMAMMKVQGDIKVRFMQLGQPQESADALAAEAMHLMLTSNVAAPEMRAEYQRVAAEQAPSV